MGCRWCSVAAAAAAVGIAVVADVAVECIAVVVVAVGGLGQPAVAGNAAGLVREPRIAVCCRPARSLDR